MGSLVSFLWKLLAGIVAAIGAAVVARTYTEPSAKQQVSSAPAHGDGRSPGDHAAATHDGRTYLGWNKPKPERMPRPTYWPAVLAFGLTFLLWGIISNIFILVFGFLITVVAVAGWINELLNESSSEEIL